MKPVRLVILFRQRVSVATSKKYESGRPSLSTRITPRDHAKRPRSYLRGLRSYLRGYRHKTQRRIFVALFEQQPDVLRHAR